MKKRDIGIKTLSKMTDRSRKLKLYFRIGYYTLNYKIKLKGDKHFKMTITSAIWRGKAQHKKE